MENIHGALHRPAKGIDIPVIHAADKPVPLMNISGIPFRTPGNGRQIMGRGIHGFPDMGQPVQLVIFVPVYDPVIMGDPGPVIVEIIVISQRLAAGEGAHRRKLPTKPVIGVGNPRPGHTAKPGRQHANRWHAC